MIVLTKVLRLIVVMVYVLVAYAITIHMGKIITRPPMCQSLKVLRAMDIVAQYLLLWPNKPSVTISIPTKLPNTLTEYSSMYKYRPCIHSVKTPVRSCISSAVTHVTGFAL